MSPSWILSGMKFSPQEDLRAELVTICESWLNNLDSEILSELTLPSY